MPKRIKVYQFDLSVGISDVLKADDEGIPNVPDSDLEPVTREDARHMALASAIIQTYPDTKEKNTEDLFLRIFWTRICAEYPESNEEDLNWARERLRYLRERGISDETLDGIAELTMAELLALDVDEDEEIHGPFDTVAELMEALNSDDDDEKIDRVADEILNKYRRAFEELAK